MADKSVTVDTQRIGAIARQVIAVAGIVFGVLTSSVSALHLPPSISTILTAGGAVLLAVEHYVSDPSTGTPPPAPPASSGATMTTKADPVPGG